MHFGFSRPGYLNTRKNRLYNGQYNTSTSYPQDCTKSIPLQGIPEIPPKIRQPARLLAQAEPLEIDQVIAQPWKIALGAVDVAFQERRLLLKVSTPHGPDVARQFVDVPLRVSKKAHFERHWASASTLGADRMEPNDRRTIRSFRYLDDVNDNVLAELDDKLPDSAGQDLDMLQPRLMNLKGFSNFFSTRLGPKLDPKALWGLIGLIVLPHEAAMKRIGQMLSKLGYSCGDFQLHARQSSNLSTGEKEACFEILVLMTRFLLDVVRFLREAGDIINLSYGRGYAQESWVELTATYDRAQTYINERLNRIKKMAKFGKRQAAQLSFLSRSPRSFVDSAKLPCLVLPPASTNRFFNRDEVIEEYIEKKKAEKGLRVIFWIRAETSFSIQESFADDALRLELNGAGKTLHDENRLLVKRWLQKTECKWLLVYDNVEDFGLLRANWPSPGSQGLALITTRNHSLALNPANGDLEVLPWDTANGTKFLLHLLDGHISTDLLASEAKSAYSLAERLSGHALAISNMSGLIHRRSWNISELLDKYGSSLNFNNGLEAIWGVFFKKSEA
ncbi:hypothetical protein BDP55DRAFT_723440 [Colletotrichum godetiae]|uniref:NB-ARC domain-containing protein n=1 Tax=Colletotrichum godetiae TaxID=1209918 RepID=A0AAJ0AX08_9PEZI|nr:uncharacterized protein BDP55DRAFT_723440 [Colletotrichum godetiae]KAK1699798.1 hypothetical protein BDP55DRAFT_723440 [Colletotrichum godetiae]